MGKRLWKELAIIVLFCITVALVLGVVIYDYNPSNKVVPGKVEAYVAPDNIKEELANADNPEEQQVVISYEIDDSDLNIYEQSKIVDPGKSNPFAAYNNPATSTNTSTNAGNSSNVGNDNSGGSSAKDNSTNSEGGSTGTLFEQPGTK